MEYLNKIVKSYDNSEDKKLYIDKNKYLTIKNGKLFLFIIGLTGLPEFYINEENIIDFIKLYFKNSGITE